MALPKGIQKYRVTHFENKHENFKQPLKEGASFELFNPKGTGFEKKKDRYRKTTKNFQWLINHAISNNIRLRALGRGWSFTKVGVSKDGIVNTLPLNLSVQPNTELVSPHYAKSPEDLYFAQCGTKIVDLNQRLFKKSNKRSIKASGASNGQTIVGAFSTGTHGSAFNTGSVQDFVVGLHIVTGSDKHVWIERESYPVIGQKFVDWLDGPKVIKNDDIFNAALVSFGSFGFIHGVMIETEPIYLLEEHRVADIPYDENLKKAMTNFDFSGLDFIQETVDSSLYHFEVLVNPHDFSSKDVFMKYIYKKPFKDHEPIVRDNNFTYGDDLLGIIQTILDAMGKRLTNKAVPLLVNAMFSLAFKSKDKPLVGTVGELFNFTKFRGKVASAAIGIDIKDSPRVMEEIIKVNGQLAYPGGLSLRFVKGTKATLGFTKFPRTCVLEMDGVDSELTKKFYNKVWTRLEELGIDFTVHWGKFNSFLNKPRAIKMYGSDRYNSWVKVRNELLDISTMNVFTNSFMVDCGLDEQIDALA